MAHPEQSVNRALVFCFLFFLSCQSEKTQVLLNNSDVNLDLSKNPVVYNKLPFSGKVYGLHKNSPDTLWTGAYKNGLKSGVWKKFYKDAVLKEVRYFKKNKKVGDYNGYYKNGSLNFIYQFENGEYNGTNRFWTKNGFLFEERNYKAGYEFGSQKVWYLNGKVRSNYVIKNNRRYGLLGTKNCINVSDELGKI